jgi:flavin reductase (DIM6/NTAB) family NADH-FMN oxidoreductase RutF
MTSSTSLAQGLRAAMARYTTGVAVVSAAPVGGAPVGLTCNSLTSVSLDPPIVLVCIGHGSSSRSAILEAGHFGVSILREDAAALSRRFASESPADRFAGLELVPGVTGAPLLAGALSWLDCAIIQTEEVGDHTVVFGRVEAAAAPGAEDGGPPLVYFAGQYRSLGS